LFIAVKGAPESVLAFAVGVGTDHRSDLGDEERRAWLANASTLAEDGLRVLALADKAVPVTAKPTYEALNFLGLVGFRDPPRPEVKDAIAACRRAGIRVVMVTGDHAVTARKIAEMLGIIEPQSGILVEGRDLKPLSQIHKDERDRLLAANILARVTPAQKLDLVTLYQSAGDVVAMTGDGVNDAPALQKADIGVAMGLRGTEEAREAAAIVLRDDAFGSIVAAIREGRVIFNNIRRFLVYLLSCNISEVMIVALAGVGVIAFAATRGLAESNNRLRLVDARALRERGRRALDSGNVPLALASLLRAAHISPGNRDISMALAEALEAGHIAGAGLDVTDPEPLPPGHPLWRQPNAIITPHISGYTTPQWEQRQIEFFALNLEAYVKGKPLPGAVDRVHKY
jgi:soluble P-type ATPase